MPGKELSAQNQTDMIWVCRRLAAALQGGETIAAALDQLATAARSGAKTEV